MKEKAIVELDGKGYIWTGRDWYESETFLRPAGFVISRLNLLLARQLVEEDLSTTDVEILLTNARAARDTSQHKRAERVARRVLELSPGHRGALAILCSTLRAAGRPRQALKETHAFRGIEYPPLLTSRAAAYCDLKQWEAAKREVGRALAMKTPASDEAFSVVRRIKAARPDLYE